MSVSHLSVFNYLLSLMGINSQLCKRNGIGWDGKSGRGIKQRNAKESKAEQRTKSEDGSQYGVGKRGVDRVGRLALSVRLVQEVVVLRVPEQQLRDPAAPVAQRDVQHRVPVLRARKTGTGIAMGYSTRERKLLLSLFYFIDTSAGSNRIRSSLIGSDRI